MANKFIYKDKTYSIGDTISINYIIKEKNRERKQLFKGILLNIKGSTPETKMLTIRKISKSGIGVERIIPLNSPYIADIKLDKKSKYTKARANFIRNLTETKIRRNALEVRKVAQEEEKEFLEKENIWETPAILRRKEDD